MSKKCRKCKETKGLENFNVNSIYADGYDNVCVLCSREYQRNRARSKEGLIKKLFNTQKSNSKIRGMVFNDYSFKEFRSWCLNKSDFNRIYQDWADSGYLKNLKPSIDRIEETKPYAINNIRVVTWVENLSSPRPKPYRKSNKGATFNTKNISLSIDRKLLKELNDFSKDKIISRSKIISIAIRRYIEEEDKYNYEKIIQQHDG